MSSLRERMVSRASFSCVSESSVARASRSCSCVSVSDVRVVCPVPPRVDTRAVERRALETPGSRPVPTRCEPAVYCRPEAAVVGAGVHRPPFHRLTTSFIGVGGGSGVPWWVLTQRAASLWA